MVLAGRFGYPGQGHGAGRQGGAEFVPAVGAEQADAFVAPPRRSLAGDAQSNALGQSKMMGELNKD